MIKVKDLNSVKKILLKINNMKEVQLSKLFNSIKDEELNNLIKFYHKLDYDKFIEKPKEISSLIKKEFKKYNIEENKLLSIKFTNLTSKVFNKSMHLTKNIKKAKFLSIFLSLLLLLIKTNEVSALEPTAQAVSIFSNTGGALTLIENYLVRLASIVFLILLALDIAQYWNTKGISSIFIPLFKIIIVISILCSYKTVWIVLSQTFKGIENEVMNMVG